RARPCWSQIAFSALDFPALERPANATSAPLSAGSWSMRFALVRNCALRKGLDFIDRSLVAALASPADGKGEKVPRGFGFRQRADASWMAAAAVCRPSAV